MAWDIAFDPVTGDIVRDAAGGWLRTENGDTAVLNQLSIHYDRWWADPALGSRLFNRDLFTGPDVDGVVAEVKRSLALLDAEGVIANLQVTGAENKKAGRVDARTVYRVVATGQGVDLLLPAFGG